MMMKFQVYFLIVEYSFVLKPNTLLLQPFVPEVLLSEQPRHPPGPSHSQQQQQGPTADDGALSGLRHSSFVII